MPKKNMQSAKKFYNFSTEDFTGYWDKVAYEVKSGQSMMLPGFLADHLAHHLVTREMFKEGKTTETNSVFARKQYLDKCYIGDAIEAKSELEAQVKALNEVVEEVEPVEPVEPVKNKGGRPKKVTSDVKFSDVI